MAAGLPGNGWGVVRGAQQSNGTERSRQPSCSSWGAVVKAAKEGDALLDDPPQPTPKQLAVWSSLPPRPPTQFPRVGAYGSSPRSSRSAQSASRSRPLTSPRSSATRSGRGRPLTWRGPGPDESGASLQFGSQVAEDGYMKGTGATRSVLESWMSSYDQEQVRHTAGEGSAFQLAETHAQLMAEMRMCLDSRAARPMRNLLFFLV